MPGHIFIRHDCGLDGILAGIRRHIHLAAHLALYLHDQRDTILYQRRFINFRPNNRDAQFLEWNEYLVRKIAAVFMLAPMDLMLERDVNRNTSEVQQENTDDRGLKPLLGRVSDTFTREICWDEGFGGPENNMGFQFTALNLRESMTRAQINRYATGGVPTKTINEARRDDGRPPLGDAKDESNPYNQLIINTSRGLARVEDIPTAREMLAAGTSKPQSDGANKAVLVIDPDEQGTEGLEWPQA